MAPVKVYEVGLRDGLQNEAAFVPTPEKLAFVQALADAGLRHIELTSFVSPRWIPQLADHDQVAREAPRREGVTYSALVPNLRGLEGALEAGLPEIAVFMSASESHSRKNINKSVPEALDLSREPQHVQSLYGIDHPDAQRFGSACLMARRLAEKGVRFIQVTSTGWDHHNQVRSGLQGRFAAIDQPIAGLIADLKQRDMLKETLIVWGGEFGRGAREDNPGGRGHNAKGFTMWMAGGGVKGGLRYGATDELGETAVEGIVGTHDLHATILHLLGLDHERLTFRYAGRDFRLTDTGGQVAKDILA